MWKPSKKILFIMMLASAILCGLSLSLVNWEYVKNGKNLYYELNLPMIFAVLSFLFMIPYVKLIREDK